MLPSAGGSDVKGAEIRREVVPGFACAATSFGRSASGRKIKIGGSFGMCSGRPQLISELPPVRLLGDATSL